MMDDLIKRLEEAEDGSRELDLLIAEAIGNNSSASFPHYTTSLDAAILGENIIGVWKFADETWEATHHEETANGFRLHTANAHSEALVRRIAALKARNVT